MNAFNKTGHGPGCPSPVGGDCDCRVEHDMECPARHRVYDVTDCTCGKTQEFALAEVWCGKCDQPATVSIELTTGETVFRCSEHAWLIVAPRGALA